MRFMGYIYLFGPGMCDKANDPTNRVSVWILTEFWGCETPFFGVAQVILLLSKELSKNVNKPHPLRTGLEMTSGSLEQAVVLHFDAGVGDDGHIGGVCLLHSVVIMHAKLCPDCFSAHVDGFGDDI